MQINKTDFDIILNTPVFRGAAESLVRRIVSADDCIEQSFKKGDTVYDRFDFMHSLGVILEGSIRVQGQRRRQAYAYEYAVPWLDIRRCGAV